MRSNSLRENLVEVHKLHSTGEDPMINSYILKRVPYIIFFLTLIISLLLQMLLILQNKGQHTTEKKTLQEKISQNVRNLE